MDGSRFPLIEFDPPVLNLLISRNRAEVVRSSIECCGYKGGFHDYQLELSPRIMTLSLFFEVNVM